MPQINNIDDRLEIAPLATADKVGFWGATPAVQPTSANQAAIGTLETIGDTSSSNESATITNNFTTIKTLVNQLRTDLVAVGLIKGS